MKTSYNLRRDNLKHLMAQEGGPTSLARKLGHANGSYLAQLAGPNPSREISEKVAREFEAKLNLPIGWLDRVDAEKNPPAPPLGDDMLGLCVSAVARAVRDAGRNPNPESYGTLIDLAYEHTKRTNQVDETFINKLVGLLGK